MSEPDYKAMLLAVCEAFDDRDCYYDDGKEVAVEWFPSDVYEWWEQTYCKDRLTAEAKCNLRYAQEAARSAELRLRELEEAAQDDPVELAKAIVAERGRQAANAKRALQKALENVEVREAELKALG